MSLLYFFKFFLGILLLQVATGLLLYLALKMDLHQTWLLFGGLLLVFNTLAALWFHGLSESLRKQHLAKAQVKFSRERERLQVRAEREKAKASERAQEKVQRVQRRSETGSQIKTGILIGGALSAGAVLLLTQMVTLGLLTLTTVGGAALGYGLRTRQERLGLAPPAKPLRILEPPVEPAQLEDRKEEIGDRKTEVRN